MGTQNALLPVHIGPGSKQSARLALGCWSFGSKQWTGQEDDHLLAAMATALDNNITHFDTAVDYGDGYSELLIGRFLSEDPARRERVFLASKENPAEVSAAHMLAAVDGSRQRMQTDLIDLYYIHWPRTGTDLRPLMEGLETARQQGKIGAVGVSNFSVEQMAQVAEVGTIDAHQLNYNLFWRYKEQDVIPYCVENQIAIVTYSSIAHGILSGKFERALMLSEGDQRHGILLFRDDVWPHIYEAVEQLKALAAEVNRPLVHLAIRWVLHQQGITSVLVGARNARQVEQNVEAMEGEIPDWVFERMTVLSDETLRHIPNLGNVYGYYP